VKETDGDVQADSIPAALQEIIEREHLEIVDSSVRLEYDYWSTGERQLSSILIDRSNLESDQILQAILPLELLEESPTGYTQVGHVGTQNCLSPTSSNDF
jgi:tRNA (guanine37-N1)-methyltransferase